MSLVNKVMIKNIECYLYYGRFLMQNNFTP